MAHQTQMEASSSSVDQLVRSILDDILPRQSSEKSRIGQALLEKEGLPRLIDHTLLKPDATTAEITKLCNEARNYGFATVCVNSSRIPLATELLKSSKTLPIAVIGFPLGACLTSSKVSETQQAIAAGAREIDMVIQVGALKDGNYLQVFKDIQKVVQAAGDVPVKVILETALLNREQKAIACALSKAAGAAFVKTSTGFVQGGATVEDISLMRYIVGPSMGVKASGGIRTHADAMKMIEAGATRIGASASVAIVTNAGAPSAGQY